MSSADSPPSVGTSRYGYLDSLRGVAALLVLIYHALRAYERANWPTMGWERFIIAISNDWLNFGKIGVAIFFIVSGFVIPSSLREEKRHPIMAFLISRFARLYPAYWLSILFALFAYATIADTPFSISTILANFTMLQQFFGIHNIIDVYWTLQIEIIFYGLCVALFAARALKKDSTAEIMAWVFLIIAIIFSAIRWSSGSKIPVAVPLALFLMFMGFICRGVFVDGKMGARPRAARLIVGFTVIMPIISLLAYNRDMGFGEKWYSYTFSYFFATFFTVTSLKYFRKRLNFLEWCGRVSYSVYLFHYVIILVLVHSLKNSGAQVFSPIIFTIIVAGVTLILSWLVYSFVELPFIQLGKRISAKVLTVPEKWSPAPKSATEN